ncbi:hypothetical protein L0337_12735 [candidate division KSB1 bacterium]|nr:hypothetical protein [candidate division KSB1 bacterium]
MKTKIWVVSLVFLFSQTAFSQMSKNMVLAGFKPTADSLYHRTVNFADEGPIADVWGWTYQGREYALICLKSNRALSGGPYLSGSGVAIVDVTDPNNVIK